MIGVASKSPVDLLLVGGAVLTMDGGNRVFTPGAVAVSDGRIVSVGPADEVTGAYVSRETLHLDDHAILPGLVDTYSHAGHGLMKGVFHPQRWWPASRLYFHGTTPQWWETEATLSAIERVRFGVTTGHTVLGATPSRADDAIYADAHIRGVQIVGSREVLSLGPPDPFISQIPSPWTATDWRGGTAVERQFTHEQCVEVVKDVARRYHEKSGGRTYVSLHPPYLLGRFAAHPRHRYEYRQEDRDVMLAHALEMREVANELGVRILTHVFRGSLQWAAKNFGSAIQTILGTDVMLAHANGLTADEVDIVARSGCSVICAPSTEENVMYGVCPVTSLIERGVPVAICSDGNAPRYSMDLWKDLYRCMFHQWVSNSDLDVLPAGRALRMVTIEAARVIGLDNEIGSLEEGKCADIIAVDLSQPHLTPQVALPNLLAYYVGGHDVDTVIVGGRVIMRERTIETADVKEVVKRARVEAAAAFARVPVNDYLVFDQTYWNGSRYPRTPLA